MTVPLQHQTRKRGARALRMALCVWVLGFAFSQTSVRAQSVSPPDGIVVDNNGKVIHKPFNVINDHQMDQVSVGDEINILCACSINQFFTGIRLSYMDHQLPTTDWQLDVSFEVFEGLNSYWGHTLQLDMSSQQLLDIVFHDEMIDPGEDWYVKITAIEIVGDVPLSAIALGFDYYEANLDNFDPTVTVEDLELVAGVLSWRLPDMPPDDAFSPDGYDVEWVLYEDEHELTYGTAQQAFENRTGVRMTTLQPYVEVDEILPDGTLYFRVRTRSFDPDETSHVQLGQWAYAAVDMKNQTNPEPDMNWQRVSTYAEDGKKKHVVSFYDGLMKNVQVLTNYSSIGKTLVAESKYDFEGRKVVDFLPVASPTDDFVHREWNYFGETADKFQYKSAYDHGRQDPEGSYESSLAADYYNNSTDLGVPLAGAHPYTQIQYKNDGLGLPERQGGVGEQFKLFGGNTVNYFYGAASNKQLERLFGEGNFGSADHYRKNLVQDANGQVSVTYLDASGKTVATALAGDNSDNLESLPSKPGTEEAKITIDLSERYEWVNGQRVTFHSFLNVAPSEILWSSSFQAFASRISINGSATEKCAACTFEITVQILDPDGIPVDLGDGSSEFKTIVKSGETSDCEPSGILEYMPASTLFSKVGEYKIIKSVLPIEQGQSEIRTIVESYPEVQTELSVIASTYQLDDEVCEVETITDDNEGSSAVLPEIVAQRCENIKRQIMSELNATYGYTWDNMEAVFGVEDGSAESDAILNHPQYCQYEDCLVSQESDIFDGELYILDTWTDALALYGDGDPRDIDPRTLMDLDPQFAGLSTTDPNWLMMSDLLDNVEVAGRIGRLEDIVNPENTELHGDPDRDGIDTDYNLLYYDLHQRYESEPDELIQALRQQRWTLYRAFYLDAKRQVRLAIAEEIACQPVIDALRQIADLPTDPYEIAQLGQSSGIVAEITEDELTVMLSVLTEDCDLEFEEAQLTLLRNNLRSYFLARGAEALRFILAEEVNAGTNEHLNEIQSVMIELGCNLVNTSLVVNLECAEEMTFGPVNLTQRTENLINNASQDEPTCLVITRGQDLDDGAIVEVGGPGQAIHPDDRRLVARLWDLLDGEAWSFASADGRWTSPPIDRETPSGSLKDDYCGMDGLSPYKDSERLAFVDVRNKGITGSLPDFSTINTDLDGLFLHGNDLEGDLERLRPIAEGIDKLSVSYNNFSGPVPEWMGGIRALYLSYNLLTFEDLVPLAQYRNTLTIANGQFHASQVVGKEQTIAATADQRLQVTIGIDRNISARFPGAENCKYAWYGARFGDEGQPVRYTHFWNFYNERRTIYANESERILNFSEDNHTIDIDISDEDYDFYYYEIINETAGLQDVVMTSEPIYVDRTGEVTWPGSACIRYTAGLYEQDFQALIDAYEEDCRAELEVRESLQISVLQDEYLNGLIEIFVDEMRTNCSDNLEEGLQMSFKPKEYHHTLYYYDRAGNLAQTIPPKGVNLNDPTSHALATTYKYNSLNQLVEQESPDGGLTRFRYNAVGQLRLSQNAQQLVDGTFSYTKYDRQSRIIEVGLMYSGETLENLTARLNETDFPAAAEFVLEEMTRTYYDRGSYPDGSESGYPDAFKTEGTYLRGRVAFTEVWHNEGTRTAASYYRYDPHGNVQSLVQYIDGLGEKRIDYAYDLISGNVNYVMYQRGAEDSYMHRYTYDDDNRITEVHTSRDGVVWDRDARYEYYDHGPLKNVQLGEAKVQRLDYYYTLQGWLKGINVPDGDPFPGGNPFAKDEFALTLGYYPGDFHARPDMTDVDGRDKLWDAYKSVYFPEYGEDDEPTGLLNGNISWMSTYIDHASESAGDPNAGMQAMMYKYDQLNRIMDSRGVTDYTKENGFQRSGEDYDSEYEYDGNGNLLRLIRKDQRGLTSDDLTYMYPGVTSNQLERVINGNPEVRHQTSGAVTNDDDLFEVLTLGSDAFVKAGEPVEVQATEEIVMTPGFFTEPGAEFTASTTIGEPTTNIQIGKYTYDEIGNLINDAAEGTTIDWTVYGKVEQVTHDAGASTEFLYDAAGNRVSKSFTNGGTTVQTFYVRDASGNIMAVYQDDALKEIPIYGSNRLGQYTGEVPGSKRFLGRKNYELSNHLGNVVAVVTDELAVSEATGKYAVVQRTTDYYPFGLEMPGRTLTGVEGRYRYGFNGKEKDSDGEWGSANHYDYGFRIYNPRIAKFLSVDPLTKSYPWYTPYQFAGNKPIRFIDLDGLEEADPQLAQTPKYPVLTGVGDATAEWFVSLYSFVVHDAWQSETWDAAAQYMGEFGKLHHSLNYGPIGELPQTPMIDSQITSFEENVVHGDQYTRTKAITTLGLDVVAGVLGDKGISKLRRLSIGPKTALFRGTYDGNLGGRNSIAAGITHSSTNPLVSLLYAIEHQTRTGIKGILEIMSPEKAKSLNTYTDPLSLPHDFEVFVELNASDFTSQSSFRLSVDQAREIFKDMGIDNIPENINGGLDNYIKELGGQISDQQIETFYKKASEL